VALNTIKQTYSKQCKNKSFSHQIKEIATKFETRHRKTTQNEKYKFTPLHITGYDNKKSLNFS
jgi:hypothetical protein